MIDWKHHRCRHDATRLIVNDTPIATEDIVCSLSHVEPTLRILLTQFSHGLHRCGTSALPPLLFSVHQTLPYLRGKRKQTLATRALCPLSLSRSSFSRPLMHRRRRPRQAAKVQKRRGKKKMKEKNAHRACNGCPIHFCPLFLFTYLSNCVSRTGRSHTAQRLSSDGQQTESQ